MNTLKKMLLSGSFLLLIFPGSCQQSPPSDKNKGNNGGLTLPPGFSAVVFADKLGSGRHIAARDNGDVYLALRSLENGKGIVALRDKNNDGVADSAEYFWNTLTTGMEIRGEFLYFSNLRSLQGPFIPWSAGSRRGTGSYRRRISFQNQHQDKTFTLDAADNLYVNVGAPSNACTQPDRTPGTPGLDPCPQLDRHAGIWRFKADVPGQDQVRDGYHYASGIRNSIALDWNYTNNKLYVVQHGRDQLSYLYPNLYSVQEGADLPAEEFFIVEDGDFFGWPYCYYDQIRK